jgi:hypothetical protein
MALTGLKLATDPVLVRRIREEFTERLIRDRDHVPRRAQ